MSGTVSQDPPSPDQAGGAASPKTVFANERDRHLFGPGPKRILALDGGGVRGAITVAFLERIETLLSKKHGPNVRLCDHFDLIGGTSTGAIIGGALALGKSTKQVEDFYLKLAPQVFSRPHWRRLFFLRAKFDARRLRREIDEVVGDLVLESSELATGFALIAKRMDTGSPWIIANNPRAPYWEDSKDHIGNRHYPLSKLVRASTAAPHFFDPEFLRIVPDDVPPDEVAKLVDRSLAARFISALLVLARLRRPMTGISKTHGIFVDGGVTPHGNPALALLQMATLKPFGICWPASPDRLTVVSIGTGSHRPQLAYESLGFAGSLRLAYRSLLSMMNDSQWLVLALMQWMGECLTSWQINSEIGSLCDSSPPGGKMFRFVRYDVRLERDWLTRELGREVSAEKIERYRCIDDPGVVDELYEIGQIIAERQVKPEHWID